jgi:outer membrane protein assembly factor BamD (BamD/ComL family)
MKKIPLYSLLFSLLCVSSLTSADYRVKEGKIVNGQKDRENSVQECFAKATDAYGRKAWEELVQHSLIVVKNFPTTPFSQEATFYLGVGYFHLRDYELSNKQFSSYLKRQTTPRHFEEAIQYKFDIAERFQQGAKKHLMGWETMPKWAPAKEDAVAIYDEVITALPHHDLGARALYGKAKLLVIDQDYKAAIEAYQTLIRRFPKNSLAAEAYLGIGEIYLTQCQAEYPDPDFLDLAQINLRKFHQEFPGEKRVAQAEKAIVSMKEIYAQSLYETGQFFERTKKPNASLIYYSKVLSNYPETKIASQAQDRLKTLKSEKIVKQERVKNKAILVEAKAEENVAQALPEAKSIDAVVADAREPQIQQVEELVAEVPQLAVEENTLVVEESATSVEPILEPYAVLEEKTEVTTPLEDQVSQVNEEVLSLPVASEEHVSESNSVDASEQHVGNLENNHHVAESNEMGD